MTSAATITLDEAAQQLKRPSSDIEAAALEVFNRDTAIMFNAEEIERLSMYFREKETASRDRSKRRKLSIDGRGKSRKVNSSQSNVLIERRKERGRKKDKKPVAEAAVEPPAQVVEAAGAVAEAIKPATEDSEEIKRKRAEQDKMLNAVSDLNKAKEAEEPVVEKAAAREPAAEAAAKEVAPAKEPAARVADEAKGKKARAKRGKMGGTLTVQDDSVEARNRRLRRRRAVKSPPKKQEFQLPAEAKRVEVMIPERISIRALASAMALKYDAVMDKFAEIEDDVEEVEEIDQDTASLIVSEFGHIPVAVDSDKDSEYIANIKEAVGKEVITRPPVVTIMGHVDHGKTSLLDYMRKSKVVETESGGITQHIGAYQVDTPGGKVTFIDTPGHEVFTDMRARGANVTDIVVLVVAADDGVQPQTKEAIDHAKAAGVPIVVAVNKIDVAPEGRKDVVMQQLGAEGLQPEEWGGDVMVVPVSAMTGEGIDKLLEAILLTAELHEDKLKASVDIDAHGSVIEAKTEKGLGSVITGLVRQGVLRKGQFLLCDTAYGRIRALRDEDGRQVDEVGPSTPVQIQGISELPKVGCEFYVADSEVKAREHAEERRHKLRQQALADQNVTIEADSFEEQFEMMKRDEERKVLNVIVKADVAGTCEALKQNLAKIGNEEAQVNVIHSGVGPITDSDVTLAQASAATVVGFRVSASGKTRKMIGERSVRAVFKDVFYEITDFVKAELEGMLVPIVEEHVRGKATVKEVFNIHKVGKIAGCGVVEGKIEAKMPVRVVRDGAVIYKTRISELRHHKDKVQSVNAGSDCGIHLDRFSDFKPGDAIESIEEINIEQKL